VSTHRSIVDAIKRADGGVADNYWHRYYTPGEVEEVIRSSVTTMAVSCRTPIHVRIWPVAPDAPTVVMAHGLLPFGLTLLRMQLALFHAGFNVVQWDLPGFGLSGGPRGGCTIPEIIDTWSDMIGWAHEGFGDPLFTIGFAEDGVTCYYAAADDPRVAAMSIHILVEYGDPGNAHWLGPNWLVRLQSMAIRPAAGIRPSHGVKVTDAISFDILFGPRAEGSFRNTFEDDPLRSQVFELRLAESMLAPLKPRVRFEDCRKPVQVIASENNQVWPYKMVKKYFDRLGGPKRLVTLDGRPHWEFTPEFERTYIALAVDWFREHGAVARQP
jgi:pimeloyl-ACP methyl ester carboxylesterase